MIRLALHFAVATAMTGLLAINQSAQAQTASAAAPAGMVLPTATAPIVIWTPASNGQVPAASAIIGGQEQGHNLPVCRAAYNGGTHPGKVVGQTCNFGWGGKEMRAAQYDVLTGNGQMLAQNPQLVRWVPAQLGQVPAGAFLGAHEPGRVLPICRARYQGSVQPGKLVAQNCNFGFAGREVLAPQYEVLVVSRFVAQPSAAEAMPAARGSNIGGVTSIQQVTLQNMDLESALMAVQANCTELLDNQLKQQIEGITQRNTQVMALNEQLAKLRMQANATTDPAAKQKLAAEIKFLEEQIDSLSNAQQMDMLRVQSMTNKRNEAFDLMTNFIKKLQESRSSILGNMR